MKRYIASLLILLSGIFHTGAADFQWSAPVDGIISTENGAAPKGFLWISPDTGKVKALMFAFQNMSEETLFKMESFRKRMASSGVALLWIAPGYGLEWDISQGIQDPFDNLIAALAEKSGHDELSDVPLIPFGHSAQATMPWNFAAWNPNRTLCVISYHGDAPRTNLCGYGRSNVEWGRTRNIDGIPGLMVVGEYEWWEARITPALAFRMMYPQSCISFLGDAGRGHFDLSERTASYLARFIEKSIEKRIVDGKLLKINPTDGWLAARWHPSETLRPAPAPQERYSACRHEAFWYFDEEMATAAEAGYAETEGKRPAWIGFVNAEGTLMKYNPQSHCKTVAEIAPDADDTFHIDAVFSDSTRTELSSMRDKSLIDVKYVSGPAVPLGNNCFCVDRGHPTWKNPRRRGRITLCAEAPSDTAFKETVQEIEIIIQKPVLSVTCTHP